MPDTAGAGTVEVRSAHTASAEPSTSLPRRTMKATAVGALMTVLAISVHGVAGGAIPSPALLIALGALAALAAVVVAQFRLPPWSVLLLLGAGQQVLHWLLGGLGGAASSIPVPSGHHSSVSPAGSAPTGGGGGGHSPESMLMLHGHLGAALLVGWLILRRRRLLAWWRLRGQGARTAKGASVG